MITVDVDKELEEQYKDIYLNQFVKISTTTSVIYYCKIAWIDIIPTISDYIIKLWCTSYIETGGEIYTTIDIRDSDLGNGCVVFYDSVDNLEKYVKIIDKQDFKDLLKNEVNKLIKTL